MRYRAIAVAMLAAPMMMGLGGTSDALGGGSDVILPDFPIVAERSLVVTDPAVLANFSLERVLTQLVSQSGAPGATPLKLFQQWWDIQNPAGPSIGLEPRIHCDDELTWQGVPGLNGYPWECPRREGGEARLDPFSGRSPLYKPVGLFNRFDLAPLDGANCGEYRIVYTRTSDTNFMIFEAVLPNPNPSVGLEGCRDVAQFWADLSNPRAPIAELLEGFYFVGIPGFEPVVHVDHYGMRLDGSGFGVSSGQIRTNQFMQGPWNLREFKLVRDCRCLPCRLEIVPTTVKDNPYGEFFAANNQEPLRAGFESALIESVETLAIPDVNRFHWNVSNKLNAAESESEGNTSSDYESRFGAPGLITLNSLPARLKAELLRIGSSLEPIHIVRRAQALSCAGCHLLSSRSGPGTDPGSTDLGDGIFWPTGVRFTHIDEGGNLSAPMNSTFLPFRLEVLMDFLAGGFIPVPPAPPQVPLPAELQLVCTQQIAASGVSRTYSPEAMDALRQVTAAPIGGRRVH